MVDKIDRRKVPSRPKAARKGSTRHILRKRTEKEQEITNEDIDEFLESGLNDM